MKSIFESKSGKKGDSLNRVVLRSSITGIVAGLMCFSALLIYERGRYNHENVLNADTLAFSLSEKWGDVEFNSGKCENGNVGWPIPKDDKKLRHLSNEKFDFVQTFMDYDHPIRIGESCPLNYTFREIDFYKYFDGEGAEAEQNVWMGALFNKFKGDWACDFRHDSGERGLARREKNVSYSYFNGDSPIEEWRAKIKKCKLNVIITSGSAHDGKKLVVCRLVKY